MRSTPLISPVDREGIESRHAAVLQRSFLQRFGLALGLAGAAAYLVACFFFFNVGPALKAGQWDRATAYLQDWVSWRAQPRLRFEDGKVEPRWTLRGQYPQGAEIDWLQPRADSGYTVYYGGEDNRLEVTTTAVDVILDGVSYPVAITPEAARAEGALPDAIRQEDAKVIVNFGFAGQAEIRSSQVYVQRRFLGWANFFFDTQSAFWGKTSGELVSLAFSGERVDPARSNIAAMIHDFLENRTWQHREVFSQLMQTLVMAFIGTLFGTALAFPLAFLAARNITPSRAANWGMKRLFDFLRSVDMLIWALFFTRGFGPGPIPGIAAIFFTDSGALGKVYSEAIENIDEKQREGMKALGAAPALVNRFGVVPQVLPVFVSQSLYFFESNIRSATVIGAVGAGGIGLKLLEAMGTNADWDKVAYMVLLILAVVFIFDNISNSLRWKLIGRQGH